MAALLGAIPLAIGAGEGGELRRPLGIAIVGGLILSQALTLYTTPVVYLYLDHFRLWWSGSVRRRRPAAAPPPPTFRAGPCHRPPPPPPGGGGGPWRASKAGRGGGGGPFTHDRAGLRPLHRLRRSPSPVSRGRSRLWHHHEPPAFWAGLGCDHMRHNTP